MTSGPSSRSSKASHRRTGLVLGAGGVLGAAWMAGALSALEGRLDRPLADAELIIGTSAGSVLAASLRCGVPVDTIVEYQRGGGRATAAGTGGPVRESGPLPPVPRLRLGSPSLLARAVRAPRQMNPWVVASGLLPQGRANHRVLEVLLAAILAQADGRVVPGSGPWPRFPTWIMCVDYDSGGRVSFGRAGGPTASLSEAVVASCSVPGWHEPKSIGGRRYVDGGIVSTTSLELVAQADLDDVYVLAPMASYETDHSHNPSVRGERLLRHFYTAALTREIAKVRATGTEVAVLTPGPEDLAAIGGNLMDTGRREQVLEVSLQTSPRQVAALERTRHAA